MVDPRRRGLRGFVPRAGRAARPTRWDWAVALAGWTHRDWQVTAARAAGVADRARRGTTRTARRVAKRAGLRVGGHPGAPVTARPVGTRMGKGKGKLAGHRRWTPRGDVLFEVATPAAARGLAVLAGRAPTGGVVRRRFY